MQIFITISDENNAMLEELKKSERRKSEVVNDALDMYRIMHDDKKRRVTEALRKQEAAAQAHVDELFNTMSFHNEAFKRAWVEAVLDRFEDYVM